MIDSCIFPSCFKIANVIPVFKKGDSSDVSNYRPISLLSVLGKVMERCIYKHLNNFLVDNNVITAYQSGFRQGDSAVYQLLDFTQDVFKALDEGKEIRVVFCDISKAFDRVWHNGLLKKLESIGIKGNLLIWFKSYLTNRKQRVVIRDTASSWVNITAGVPQGSILGPLLFIIYINDIVQEINCKIKLFADDTSLYIIVENPMQASVMLNSDLSKINNWASNWSVTFNPNKTEHMIISRKIIQPFHPSLYMNDVLIQEVETHKHLGVTFSSDFSWKQHIDNITKKANQRLSILRTLKYRLDRKSLELMYLTFIRPILEYADIVWGNITADLANKIKKINLEAARIVTGATKLTSISLLYRETGWDTMQSRRNIHQLKTFYKMYHGISPEYLCRLVPNNQHEMHPYNTRQQSYIETILCRTNYYYNSFLPSVLRLWNEIPTEIRNSSFNAFCKYIETKKKVPNWFYLGSRSDQIILTKLRLEDSPLKQHLFKKNLAENPFCLCGQIESTYHYLLQCPLYHNIRQATINTLPYNIIVNLLLYGDSELSMEQNCQIVSQVYNFISRSKRFTF